jgi:hypothetical protein
VWGLVRGGRVVTRSEVATLVAEVKAGILVLNTPRDGVAIHIPDALAEERARAIVCNFVGNYAVTPLDDDFAAAPRPVSA